jgi:hypothetical protein
MCFSKFKSRNSVVSQRHQNTNIALQIALKERNKLAKSLLHVLQTFIPVTFNSGKEKECITCFVSERNVLCVYSNYPIIYHFPSKSSHLSPYKFITPKRPLYKVGKCGLSVNAKRLSTPDLDGGRWRRHDKKLSPLVLADLVF